MYFQPGTLEMGQHFWGGDRNIPDREGTTSTTSRGSTRSVGLSRNPNGGGVLQHRGEMEGSWVGWWSLKRCWSSSPAW